MKLHPSFTISLRDIHFERQDVALWDTLSCDIASGELLEVRGKNGSGKSTLLRIVAGLLDPTDGNVLWQSQSIAHDRETYQRSLHYLGHLNAVKQNLTVSENIYLNASLLNVKLTAPMLQDILSQAGLHHHKNALGHQLSAGQLRRLSLTKLLLVDQPFWILDEPTTALDSHAESWVESLLASHLQRGGAAMIATHHPLKTVQSKTLLLGERHDQ